MQHIKLKVCGMKNPDNIQALAEVEPDYMGFIFYKESKRYVGALVAEQVRHLPKGIKTTGVFVNSDLQTIAGTIKDFGLRTIQLHGAETPELCESLKIQFPDIEVIKAFGIDEEFNFDLLHTYDNVVDYFLFDTKTPAHGGSGKSFNWEKLKQYSGEKPYFLSGGIGLEHLDEIKALNHPALYAIDINSKFELEPGLKNIAQIKTFKTNLYGLQA
ncbi:phosphoribosylanthranilate isomerase [Pedobacter duraquae]|uniref:N-(5'-phosphoribosyl)anthranilate isomerase n=2 Tax=Pedobacter duraquae TaxID=425511 RepID=A0A4R6IKT0_9SPHI|nr:phosphoribosylanthranilate isomerase [Pedobacter duraquae]